MSSKSEMEVLKTLYETLNGLTIAPNAHPKTMTILMLSGLWKN